MDKIKEYAVTNYPKTFKDVNDVIVEENDVVYFIFKALIPASEINTHLII